MNRDAVVLTGVVLIAQPVGEYDKRLVILTRERGKITAFAHGARRPKSPLIAAANTFVFATFRLHEGRDAYTLVSADPIDFFEDLARKMPGAWYGFYFLELADYFGREGMESTDMVNLIYVALRALIRGAVGAQLIRRIYEFRMLVINGDAAVPEEAGNMHPAAYAALQLAAYAPLPKLFSFSLKPEAEKDFSEYVERSMCRAVDREMKSLRVLQTLTGDT